MWWLLPTLGGRPVWGDVAHLLGDYDGMVSELFVWGLPIERLPGVLRVIGTLPNLFLQMKNYEGCDPALAWSPDVAASLLEIEEVPAEHILISSNGTESHLQIHIQIGVWNDALCVEFVFWNELTFPPDLDQDTRNSRLAHLVNIAEACRDGVPGAVCILSCEHNSSPEELLGRDYPVRW